MERIGERTVGRILSRLHPRGLVNVALTSLGIGLVILAWFQVVSAITAPIERSPRGRPNAIVWHGRVYTNQPQLVAAFREHGIPYSPWAQRHPAALSILTHRPLTAIAKHRVAEKITAKPRHIAAAPSAAVNTTSSNGSVDLAGALLWAVVLLLVAAAAAPARLLAHLSIRWVGSEQRTILVAAAGSIAVGLIVGSSG
ncbi:MAG: hypothetical protein ACJ757_16030 [Gaiellaceae bacterium]